MPFPLLFSFNSSSEFLFQMDLNFQNSSNRKVKKRSSNKYLGVRQRPSGKWVAEIKNTTKKIRMWLGTFNTAEEAARAYDEAACLLRGSNTRTNFSPNYVSSDSPLSVKIRNLLHQKKQNSITSKSQQNLKTTKKGCVESISIDSCVQVSDDAYRPDLSNCDLGSSQFDQMCAFPARYDQLPLICHQEMELQMPKMQYGFESNDLEITEFDRMRVERQISASLYAMNGVNEYLENAYLSDEVLWGFPDSLSHLLCPTSLLNDFDISSSCNSSN